MSIDLTRNFFRLLFHFRRQDLANFTQEHDYLFQQAKSQQDHALVTSHYYSVMSTVIDEYFNGNFHFVPPRENNLTLEEALKQLHMKIGECLNLKPGQKCVDIGCGIGGVIQDLSETGADITGVTIASNEVCVGNTNFENLGIYPRCNLVEADCHKMPFEDASYDSAYAIYALKYFTNLKPIMNEVARILKSDGLFVIYDLVKTDKYDENNQEHRAIVEGLEYACGMPSLHHRAEMVQEAQEAGFDLLESIDLSAQTGQPFHYCFSSSPLFMWLVRSSLVGHLIKIAQALKILPKGLDMVIEVAHPDIIKEYAKIILEHTNLFIGSPTALADQTTYDAIKEKLNSHPTRSVFVPAGAFWGSNDIQKMANLGILKGLNITMIKHPNSLKVLGPLEELCQRAKKTNCPVVLYDGPVRLLCPMAPNNVNTMAGAAIAAHNLGFDNTRAKLIADPAMTNWHIVEIEVVGENGFRTITRRENPAAPGAVTGNTTYFSFLASIQETLYKPPGINIC
uniref:Aspartate dehydrogenase domain-containing protein n=2 Tax=Acrobeloides nanus TaxID=290746 RepID=A0A914CIT3_9BILA